MAYTETPMDQLKPGDIVHMGRDFQGRSFPAVVVKVSDKMVFWQKITPPQEHCNVNYPQFFEKAVRWAGVKNAKIWGDQYNGGVSIPLVGNEHYLKPNGDTAREKKTYKHRGVEKVNTMYKIDLENVKIEYDFYIR